MSAIDDIEFKIARLDLQPGDILVVKRKDVVSLEKANHIRHCIKSLVPGYKAIILEGGMDLEILTATQIAERSA